MCCCLNFLKLLNCLLGLSPARWSYINRSSTYILQNQSVEKIDLFNNINGSLRNILQEKSRTVINLNEEKNGDETDDGSDNADLEMKSVEVEAEDLIAGRSAGGLSDDVTKSRSC